MQINRKKYQELVQYKKEALKNKGWINKIDPYGWFQWQVKDRKMIKDKLWKQIVSRFRAKLVKMIRDAGSKFNDYSIMPKIRQILLHWGYGLTEIDFF